MKILHLNLLIFIITPWIIQFNHPISSSKKFIVVLDAGHGGRDTGNNGNGYLEKKNCIDNYS